MQETQVQLLGQEDSLLEEMATHSSILASEISQTEEPGGLQFMGSQRVRHAFCLNHHQMVYIPLLLQLYSKRIKNVLYRDRQT